ncbi:hypothetical protein HDU97_000126 [Phlyctochytrium planicorne]|nr:hypothetical protein HDU97_000126 [Phlyctochytrium planicorne]
MESWREKRRRRRNSIPPRCCLKSKVSEDNLILPGNVASSPAISIPASKRPRASIKSAVTGRFWYHTIVAAAMVAANLGSVMKADASPSPFDGTFDLSELERRQQPTSQQPTASTTRRTATASSASPSPSSTSSSSSSASPSSPFSSANSSRQMGRNEPDDGNMLFSVFLDTSNDTPQSYIHRTGNFPAVYHFAQTLPMSDLPPLGLVDQTGTNASIYLSLNPVIPMESISDLHLSAVLLACLTLNRHGRRVFLRLAPGMNTPFFSYGQRPEDFKGLWSRLYRAIRSPFEFATTLSGSRPASTSSADTTSSQDVMLGSVKLEKDTPQLLSDMTALVWAPQVGLGYPWPDQAYSANQSNSGPWNWRSLDTNFDGKLTPEDDPYAPFYPGDDTVDWVGLSIYHYPNSTTIPEYINSVPLPGLFESVLKGSPLHQRPSDHVTAYPDFYQIYAANRSKPFMISETNAIFVFNATTPSTPSLSGSPNYNYPVSPEPRSAVLKSIVPPTPLAVKQGWWSQFMFNQTFLSSRPLLKMITLFEYVTPEGDGTSGLWRDYSVGNDSTSPQASILDTFEDDLQAFSAAVGSPIPRRYVFASTGYSLAPIAWPEFLPGSIGARGLVSTSTPPSPPPPPPGTNPKTEASRLVLWAIVAVPVVVSLIWGIGSFFWKRRMRKLQVAVYVRKDEDEEPVAEAENAEGANAAPGDNEAAGAGARADGNQAEVGRAATFPRRNGGNRAAGFEDLDEEDWIVLDPFGFRRRQRIREILQERREREQGVQPEPPVNPTLTRGSTMVSTMSRLRELGSWATWSLGRPDPMAVAASAASIQGMREVDRAELQRSATLPLPRRNFAALSTPTQGAANHPTSLSTATPRRGSLPEDVATSADRISPAPAPSRLQTVTPALSSPSLPTGTTTEPMSPIGTGRRRLPFAERPHSIVTASPGLGRGENPSSPATPQIMSTIASSATSSVSRTGNNRHVSTPAERDHERRASRAAGRVVNMGL